MKLGVVTTSYPRWPGDPAGNFVGAHVAALEAIGHTVDVIAAGDGEGRIPAGGLFYTGGAPEQLEGSLRSFAAAALFSARLARTVISRARSWDAVIAHWLAPSALAALPTRLPLLAIAHGGDVHTLRRMRLLSPALYALRHAQLAFVSTELRAIATAAAPWLANAIVQPMGLDLARFAAIERAPTNPPTLVIAARLTPVKGVDVALAALRLVRADVRLVIAGDGPTCHQDGVTFLGPIDTLARDRLLATASIVLVPSRVLPNGRTEGTPMIALEALAAGVPVIASAVGGLRDLAAAHLVPPDDPVALAAGIDHVLAAPPTATVLRASVTHLDWKDVAHTLLPRW